MTAFNAPQHCNPTHGRYANNWVGVNKPKVGDEFLMIAKGTGKWKTFTMTHTHCGWRSNSNGVCNGCHGTYAKGQIYDEGTCGVR